MRWMLALMLLVSCADGVVSSEASMGIDLDVRFPSYLSVATLRIAVAYGDQREDVTRSVRPHVGPPAERSLAVRVDLPDAAAGATARVTVVAVSANGVELAEGQSTIVPAAGQRSSAVVSLDPASSSRTVWTRQWTLPSLTATGTEFAEAAALTLEGQPNAQLLFISGLLSGDDNAFVDAQIRIDGEVVDEFGHHVFGPADGGGAGVFTFEILPASTGTQRLSVWLRASVGTAVFRDITIVGARLPPGATLSLLDSDDTPERTGIDVTIDRLPIMAASAGRYLVLAKMSLSELPGDNTARGWLRLPTGERIPSDSSGATFSASRDPLTPLFTQAVIDVPAGTTELALEGTSSGSGSSFAEWLEPSAAFRHPLTVSGAAPAQYAVRVVFNHAEHVSLGRSRTDGADVRLVYQSAAGAEGVRLDRVLDPASGWNRNDTTVWFRTEAPIVDTSGQYALYFGGGPVDDVQDDPRAVYAFYDDFSAGALAEADWSVLVGTDFAVDNGRLRLGSSTALATQVGLPPNGSRWEARAAVSEPLPVGLTYLAAGPSPDLIGQFEGAQFEVADLGPTARAGVNSQVIELLTPADMHDYAVTRIDDLTVRFEQDGTELATLAGGVATVATWPLRLSNRGDGSAVYEWVRIRPYVAPEPAVAVEALQGPAGATASNFRYRKLAAIRLDGWAAVHTATVTRPIVETSGPYTPLAELNVPAGDGERLILQSLRVAGARDATARRSGILRDREAIVFETAHRIDRDTSDLNGYHHVAGLAYVVTASVPRSLDLGVSSPDGIVVSGADGRILVLDYPR